MTAPCSFCGTRPDVGCKHRPAEGSAPPALADIAPKVDRRRMGHGVGAVGFTPGRRTKDSVMAAAERLFTKP